MGPSGRGLDGEIDPNKLHWKDKKLWENYSFLKGHIHPKKTRSSTQVLEIILNSHIKKDNNTYL